MELRLQKLKDGINDAVFVLEQYGMSHVGSGYGSWISSCGAELDKNTQNINEGETLLNQFQLELEEDILIGMNYHLNPWFWKNKS